MQAAAARNLHVAQALLATSLAVLGCVRSAVGHARPGGPSLPQMRLLRMVRQRPAAGLAELADRLGVSPPAASKMVDGLVALGLMERTRTPEDRRRVALRLTRAGQAQERRAVALAEAAIQRRLEGLPAKEADRLVASLAAVQAALAEGP